MLHIVDAFALIRFSLHIEEMTCECLASNLITQPDVFGFVEDVQKFGDSFNAREFVRIDRVAVKI